MLYIQVILCLAWKSPSKYKKTFYFVWTNYHVYQCTTFSSRLLLNYTRDEVHKKKPLILKKRHLLKILHLVKKRNKIPLRKLYSEILHSFTSISSKQQINTYIFHLYITQTRIKHKSRNKTIKHPFCFPLFRCMLTQYITRHSTFYGNKLNAWKIG